MSVFKCKMCGGNVEFESGATVGICDSCGTKQTLPKLDDDRKANLYDRANHFRRNNEFDKAMGIYEQILNEDRTDAESYWSIVLCRYGIEYVEDPTTHKRIPTVNRAQYTSIFDDEDYKSALQYADGSQKEIYEAEAAAINEIQKGILAISGKEDPFDVFICYKETDRNGRRTPDSVLATELYHELTREGFKVFFSRITLEDKLGQEYEPYIFAALNSAKVMIVLGTKPEYFNAVWVKNEWNRYLALIKNGARKVLIPAYKDIDPYDLPEEFSHLQAQDMSKLGFMQDLVCGIKKISGTNETIYTTQKAKTDNSDNIYAILDRAFIHLESKEWNKANRLFEDALKINPRLSDAYLGKCMCSLHVSNKGLLVQKGERLLKNIHFKLAYKFAEESQKKNLQNTVDKIQNEKKLQKAKSKKRFSVITMIFTCLIALSSLAYLVGIPYGRYLWYKSLLSDGEITKAVTAYNSSIWFEYNEKVKDLFYNKAVKFIENKEYDRAIECLKECDNYKDSAILYNYYNGLKFYNNQDFEKSISYFEKSKDYKDSEVKYFYSKAFFEFKEKNYYSALEAFDSLIKKAENIENLKEYNFCKGVQSDSISDARHYLGLCGDYDLAKKALKNLTIIEKMQGSWKEIDSPTIGFLYEKMTIKDIGGVYSNAYELAVGTKKSEGRIKLSFDDESVLLAFYPNDLEEGVSVMAHRVDFVNNNKFIYVGWDESIYIRTS